MSSVAGQPRLWSAIETATNIAVGYVVALLSQLVIFPLLGIHIPFAYNLYIGGFMTVVSVIRSYWLRRFYNWVHVNGYHDRVTYAIITWWRSTYLPWRNGFVR